MDPVTAVLVVGFGLWFLLTVANSTERGTEILTRHVGPMHIFVPKWNFFSPHPGQYDYFLFYRDRRVDGSLTDWEKVNDLNRPPGRFRSLWNPNIYRSKLVFDVAMDLNTNVKQFNEEKIRSAMTDGGEPAPDSDLVSVDLGTIELSVSYLTFLHYVTRRDHDDLAESTQFMVMQHSRATDNYEPLLVSRFHELDR